MSFMAQLMTSQPKQSIQLTMGQALIGKLLDATVTVPVKWWVTLCGTALWYIWIARNEETRQNQHVIEYTTKIKIWHEAQLYLKTEWKPRKIQCHTGKLTEEKATYLFQFDFGTSEFFYKSVDTELVFNKPPPEPD